MRPSTGARPSRKREGGETCAKSDLSLFCGNHQPDAHMCCSQKQANIMVSAKIAPRKALPAFRQAHHTTASSDSVWASLASATRPADDVVTQALTRWPACHIDKMDAKTQPANNIAPIASPRHCHQVLTSLSFGARVKNLAAASHPKAASIEAPSVHSYA